MSWECRVSRGAARQLQRLSRDRQEQLRQAIEEMQADPLRGDVRPIKSGRFRGVLRKRVGRYRILFSVDPAQHRIEIAAILLREGKTYR